MNKLVKKFVAFFILSFTFQAVDAVFQQNVHAEEATFSVAAKAAIAIDADSGKIFYEKDAKTPHYIASTTKLLSMYIVYDQIKQGKLQWTDKVKISNQVSKISRNYSLSNVPLIENAEYPVKELVYAGFLESANAAVMALTEKISGSESKFVDLMRAKAKEWAISDAVLVNSTGLNNSDLDEALRYPNSAPTDENQMSARDMAIVARHLIHDFPEVLQVTSTSKVVFHQPDGTKTPIHSTNLMLEGMPYALQGVDGLKTGTTDLAGANFVSTIKKDNVRLITVAFGVTNGTTNRLERFIQTKNLINHVFDTWHLQTVVAENTPVKEPKTIKVKKGVQEEVGMVYKDPVQLWVQKTMDPKKLKIETTGKEIKQIEAPVEKNEKIGTATIELAQDQLGYLDATTKHQTRIVTDKSIEKANLFVRIWRSILHIFS